MRCALVPRCGLVARMERSGIRGRGPRIALRTIRPTRTTLMLRDYQPTDAEAIVQVALSAFAQFEQHYSDWPLFTANVAKMPLLAKTGEIIVAEDGGQIVGAVAYVGAQAPKPAFFEPSWPIIRMLVVDPCARQGHRPAIDGRMPAPRRARPVAGHRPAHDADHDGRGADVSADGICEDRRGAGYSGRAVWGLREVAGLAAATDTAVILRCALLRASKDGLQAPVVHPSRLSLRR